MSENQENDTSVIMLTLASIQGKLDDLSTRLGHSEQDEHGVWIGTGMAGEFVRLRSEVKSRFKLYDRWTNMIVGGFMAGSVLIATMWWLTKDKLEAVFK